MEKSIYHMELHQTLNLSEPPVTILRVSGGWIYTTYTTDMPYQLSSVFVPYNSELQ